MSTILMCVVCLFHKVFKKQIMDKKNIFHKMLREKRKIFRVSVRSVKNTSLRRRYLVCASHRSEAT